jgi:SsrA-binding protein
LRKKRKQKNALDSAIRNPQSAFTFLMAEKGKKKKDKAGPSIDVIAENRKARHKFEVLDTLECGIALAGSEVKSLRMRHVSLDESYGRVKNGEVWLINCDIPEYMQAGMFNHAPKRARKLLLRKSEIRKFADKAHESGLTLVPLRLYFNERGVAKILLGLCRGKKLHDKREAMKKADSKRELSRAMRRK